MATIEMGVEWKVEKYTKERTEEGISGVERVKEVSTLQKWKNLEVFCRGHLA